MWHYSMPSLGACPFISLWLTCAAAILQGLNDERKRALDAARAVRRTDVCVTHHIVYRVHAHTHTHTNIHIHGCVASLALFVYQLFLV